MFAPQERREPGMATPLQTRSDRAVAARRRGLPWLVLGLAFALIAGCNDAAPVAVDGGNNGAKNSENHSGTSNSGTANAGTSNSATNGNAGNNGTANNSANNGATTAGGSNSNAGDAAGNNSRSAEAEAIISKLAETYRAATSYEDQAVFREIVKEPGGEPLAYETHLSVAFERPNKIRANIGGAIILSNGQKIYGSYYDVPGYVAVRETPQTLTPEDVFFDPRLGKDGLPALQIGLLLNDNMADALLSEAAARPDLLEPSEIEGHPCYRVRFIRRMVTAAEQTLEGQEVYWIDQESFVLRRIEIPAADGAERSLEFVAAKLNVELGENAFAVELDGAKEVKRFVGPAYAASLGKMAEGYEFVALDGEKLTPESLAGKVVVLDFWMEHPASLANLPRLKELKSKFAGNDKVRIVSVNIDPAATPEKVAEIAKTLNLDLTLAREATPGAAGGVFGFNNFPYIFILGPDGVVQYCEMGYGTIPGDDPVPRLQEKIDAILAGTDVAGQMIAEFEAAMSTDAPESVGGTTRPPTAVAPASAPQAITLEPAWTAAVTNPGNILVVPGADGKPRILVHEGYHGVVELSPTGEIVNRPDLKFDDVIAFTRTAVSSSGKRYFAVAAESQQQARVYDQDWNLVLAYPEAGASHPGIADVQLIDLDNSGEPQLVIGYFDIVGIQAVKLSGERTWWNRSPRDVMSIASSKLLNGSTMLLCCNTQPSGALASIKADGTRGDDLRVGTRFIRKMASVDLNGDGFAEYCGLAVAEDGSDIAVGFSTDGTELWFHPLPPGQQPILQQLGHGTLVGDQPQWVIAAADGSLSCYSPGGSVLDSFATGKVIQGFGVVEADGPRLLLISTENGVEAFKVTQKQ